MPEPLLETSGLTRRFGGLVAMSDVALAVEPGEIHAVIGPNGAGKTTLFGCVVGLLRPTAGRITFAGAQVDGLSQHAVVRRGICHSHQIPAPFPFLDVRDNIRVGASFGRRRAEAKAVVDEVLARTGLEPLASTPARNLSVGNLKLLELARALATGPELLCLDEVGSGVTPVELDRMLQLIRDVNAAGVTILYIEHNMQAIGAVCQRGFGLGFGQKIAEGPPAAPNGGSRAGIKELPAPVDGADYGRAGSSQTACLCIANAGRDRPHLPRVGASIGGRPGLLGHPGKDVEDSQERESGRLVNGGPLHREVA